jgi:hypothetical protein
MSTSPKRYTRAPFPVLLYCGTAGSFNKLIKDGDSWEDFTEEAVDTYLSEGTAMMMRLLEAFADPAVPYNSATAKELRFMLEALIEVKEIFRNDYLPTVRQEG